MGAPPGGRAVQGRRHDLRAYLPDVVLRLRDLPAGPWHRGVDASMVFMDVSGFTSMSERLARGGKVGAEEATDLVSDTFALLLDETDAYSGDLIKFGGDALLLLFDGDGHEKRACAAAVAARAALRARGRLRTSAGWVRLRISIGIGSGPLELFVVGDRHRDLLVLGPCAAATAHAEEVATAGTIAVSAATATALDARILGEERDGLRFLRGGPAPTPRRPPARPRGPGHLERFVPAAFREELGRGLEPEHRLLTSGFLGWAEAGDRLAEVGPEAFAVEVDETICIVQRAAEEHGVTFIASDVWRAGMKVLLVAGAPQASEHDEERMLLALSQVRDAAPPLVPRMGTTRAHAFVGDLSFGSRRTYSLEGDAVNLAARLMARAEPGELIATLDLLEHARLSLQTELLPPFTVKGKGAPIRAALVRGRAVEPVSGTRASRVAIVGRANELSVLESVLDRARSGRGACLEIVADPGIGKTRLVDESIRLAASMRTVSVAADEYGPSTAYGLASRLVRSVVAIDPGAAPSDAGRALHSWVRRHAPDLRPWLPLLATAARAAVPETPETARLDPTFRTERLRLAVADLLEAALPDASLIVVEDLHWSDEPSIGLIAHLARIVERHPWALVATRRPEGTSLASEAPTVEYLGLRGLGEGDTVALARAVANAPIHPDQLSRLARRAGGNPLFLQELVAAVETGHNLDDLPDTVEAVVGARIAALAPGDRALLRCAAVLGQVIDTRLVTTVASDVPGMSPADGPAFRRLSGFLEPHGRGRRIFRHALVRDVAYEGLPYRRRRALHEKALEALEASSTAGAEELALHALAAHRYDRAWVHAMAAGRHAQEAFANVEAAGFFEGAIKAARATGLPPRTTAEAYEALGDVLELAGIYERAARAFEQARRLAGPEDPSAARLCRKRAMVSYRTGRYANALRWFGMGLRADPSDADRLDIEVWIEATRQSEGHLEESVAHCRPIVEEARALHDIAAEAKAIHLLHCGLLALGRPESKGWAGVALPLFEEVGDLRGMAFHLNNLGSEAYWDGNWDLAATRFREGEQLLEKAGSAVEAADLRTNVAEILLDQGHLDEAERLLRESLDTCRAGGNRWGEALALLNLGRLEGRRGEAQAALTTFGRSLEIFREIRQDEKILELEARIAEHELLVPGRATAALRKARRTLRDLARVGDLPPVRATLERTIGMASASPSAARRHLDAALGLAREIDSPYEVALTQLARAPLLPADACAEAREEAEAIFDELGVGEAPALFRSPG